MRKSTRKSNKELLDSLIINESKAKDAIARVTAMALALFLLFGAVAGPISSSIWGMATEPVEGQGDGSSVPVQFTEEIILPAEEDETEPLPESEPEVEPTPEPESTPEPDENVDDNNDKNNDHENPEQEEEQDEADEVEEEDNDIEDIKEEEEPEAFLITGFAMLLEHIAYQNVEFETPLEDLILPGTLEATMSDGENEKDGTINDVKWQLTAVPVYECCCDEGVLPEQPALEDMVYEGFAGIYEFTAVLPAGALAASNLVLPVITVEVEPLGIVMTVTTRTALQNAVTAASGTRANPTVITVTGNFNIDSSIDVNNKHVRIQSDSTRRTLTRTGNQDWGMFRIRNGGTLILSNIIIDGNNVGANGNNSDRAAGILVEGGRLQMEDNTILQRHRSTGSTGRFKSGAVNVTGASSEFIMNGGEIRTNTIPNDSPPPNNPYQAGGVYVNTGGRFTMNGGTISGNEASTGGVNVQDNDAGALGTQINLRGGSIINNNAQNGGVHSGGIGTRGTNPWRTGNFRLSGNVNVSSNTQGTAARNIYVPSTPSVQTITIDGAIDAASRIGITTQTVPQDFATGANTGFTGTNADAWWHVFIPDNTGHRVVRDGNILRMVAATNYTITFNVNSGTGGEATRTITYGNTVTTMTNRPTRTGYTFNGYYTAASGGTQVFNAGGVALVASGHTYTNRSNPSTIEWIRPSNTTLFAQWSPAIQTVNLNRQGGTSGATSFTVPFGSAIMTGYSAAGSRTGYTFNGYWTAATGGTQVINTSGALLANVSGFTGAGGIWNQAAATTLHAQWTPVIQTVSLDRQGGATGATSFTVPFDSATMTGYSAAGGRTGYAFNGYWTATSGGALVINTSGVLQANVANHTGANGIWNQTVARTLYAQWTPNTYTVTFNGNGSTSGSMSLLNFTYDASQNLTLNNFTRTGHTFSRWTTNADGSGNSYTNGQSVSNLAASGNVILYAQWTPNSYTVLFDGNGSSSGSTSPQTFVYGITQGLVPNGYIRTGWTFNGWNTNSAGTGTFYADRQSVSNLAASGSMTLFAQWVPHIPEAATLNPDGNNGWFKSTPVTLNAPAGFSISTSNTPGGTWASSIIISGTDGANKSASYYLRRNSDSAISEIKHINYNVDTTAPSALVKYKDNGFRIFLNYITFGLFFKDTVTITISPSDSLSGVARTEYHKAGNEISDFTGVSWVPGTTLNVTQNEKFILYVRITDNAGNFAIFYEGIVVYTDSTSSTTNIDHTKFSGEETATVNLNGNTIADIKNGEITLTRGTHYTISGSIITFLAPYLDSLVVGTYTFTVLYYPMGESYINPHPDSDTSPAVTTIILSIGRAEQAVLSITNLNEEYTYGNSSFTLGTSGGSGTGDVTYEIVSGSDVISLDGAQVTILKAGTFTIKTTKAGDVNYSAKAATSSEITVIEATPTVTMSGERYPDAGSILSTMVRLTAVITPPEGTSEELTGTVTFRFKLEGADRVETVTLDASCTVYYIIENFPEINPDPSIIHYTATYNGKEGYYTAATGTLDYDRGKVPQYPPLEIDWPEDLVYGDNPHQLHWISAGSTHGKLTYERTSGSDAVATVSIDGLITIFGAGNITVRAVREGNENYNEAVDTSVITIARKSVTITGITAGNKVYDGSTAAIPDTTEASLDGNIDGSGLTFISGVANFGTKDAGVGKTIGFSSFILSGSRAANYTLPDQPASVTADITPATLIVTPNTGQQKFYGNVDPAALLYSNTGSVTGETPGFSGTLSRTAGETIGTYTIFRGSLALEDNGAFLAGNYTLSVTGSRIFTIVQASLPQVATLEPDGANGWFKSVPVILTAPEGFSISTSNTHEGPWTPDISLNDDEGTDKNQSYYLRRISDGAISAIKQMEYKVDTTAPTISVSGNTTTYKQSDNLAVIPAAGISGIAKVEVQKDGGSPADITVSYATGYTVTSNGTYTFLITNGAGVSTTTSITYTNINTTKPVIDIESGAYTSGSWTNNDVTLSITDSASTPGTTIFEFSTDGGDTWHLYSGPITLTAEGEFSYTFKATAESGITGDVVTIYIRIDKTAPILTGGAANRSTAMAATVMFSSNKTGTFYYQFDGIAPENASALVTTDSNAATMTFGTDSFILDGLSEGTHTVYVAARDAAGNISNMLTIQVAPLTIITINEAAQTVIFNAEARNFEIRGTYLTDFTFTYNQGDGDLIPRDAGNYNIVISRPPDSTYASFSKVITNGLAILPLDISTAAFFAAEISDQLYSGIPQTPAPTTVIANGIDVTYSLGDWTLNTNAGTATVLIGGTGNFTGSQTAQFKILPVDLTGIPTITGSLRVGQTLTVNTSTLNANSNIGSGTSYNYRWHIDGVGIGTDSSTYIIQDQDIGKMITVTVTASGNYEGSQSSLPSPVVTEKEVSTLRIATQPQLVYIGGDLLDLEALKVEVEYEDASVAILEHNALGLSFKINGEAVFHNNTMMIFSAQDGKPLTVTYSGVSCDTEKLTVYASPVLSIIVSDLSYNSAAIKYSVKQPDKRYTIDSRLQVWAGSRWENVATPEILPEEPQSLLLTSLPQDTEYEYRLLVKNNTSGKEYTAPLIFRTKLSVSSGVEVRGTVNDPDRPSDIILTIEHGNTVIASMTVEGNGTYNFTFNNIPDGVYNLVADNGNYKVTVQLWIEGENVSGIIINMDSVKTQSVIKIMTPDTPPAAVNGLPDLFDDTNGVLGDDDKALLNTGGGGTVEIRLEVAKNDSPDDATLITEIATGKTIGLYLDIALKISRYCDEGSLLGERQLLTLINSANEHINLITITFELPDELKSKTGLMVYRVHEGEVEQLSAEPNDFGEIAVIENKYVIIKICRFSTFAIAHTPDPIPPSSSIPPSPPAPEPTPIPSPTPMPTPEPTPEPPPEASPEPPPELPDSSDLTPPTAPTTPIAVTPILNTTPDSIPEITPKLTSEPATIPINSNEDGKYPMSAPEDKATELSEDEDGYIPINQINTNEPQTGLGVILSRLSNLLRFAPGPVLNMTLDLEVGASVAGKSISVEAEGLMPISELTITIYSTPQLVGAEMTDKAGNANILTTFPDNLESGIHVVIAEGICPDGFVVQAVAPFEIDGNGILVAFTEPAQLFEPIDPGDPRIKRSLKAGVPLYDAKSDPETVAQVAVTFGLLGGIAAIAGVSKKRSGKVAKIYGEDDILPGGNPKEKWGDKYGLWKISLFLKTSDKIGVRLQERTAKTSFILNRFTSDGSWARAMFGSGGFVLWLIGIALGVYSSMQTGHNAFPPDFVLVLFIVALGILDSGAGFLAWLTIAVLAIVNGNAAGTDEIRTLVGMFTLFATILILGGTRPLRRKYNNTQGDGVISSSAEAKSSLVRFVFDRIADYIMPTIYIILATSTVLKSINGLSGLEFFGEEHIIKIRYVAIAAYWVRMLLEDLADYAFPVRNKAVRPEQPGEQITLFQWGAMLLYAGMFMVVTSPFFGIGTAVVLILAFDIVPWMLSFIKDRFPNSEFLYRYYPGTSSPQLGFVLMLISIGLSAMVASSAGYRGASAALIIVALPYALAEIPSLFGREGIAVKDGWAKRLVEFGCWCGFAAVVLLII